MGKIHAGTEDAGIINDQCQHGGDAKQGGQAEVLCQRFAEEEKDRSLTDAEEDLGDDRDHQHTQAHLHLVEINIGQIGNIIRSLIYDMSDDQIRDKRGDRQQDHDQIVRFHIGIIPRYINIADRTFWLYQL